MAWLWLYRLLRRIQFIAQDGSEWAYTRYLARKRAREMRGIAECFTCRHRWLVVLKDGESVDWIDCPECGEQGRMVRYPLEDGDDDTQE